MRGSVEGEEGECWGEVKEGWEAREVWEVGVLEFGVQSSEFRV